ncbi:MAG: hypothetical protein ACJ0KI_05275 [Dehalococcoidia bacterium]|tara:strand:- start:2958 stop:3386 length:429 start_codon:yes stop_codon:yes gene_type:complete
MNKHYEMFVLNYNALNHPKEGQSYNDILSTADKIIAKGTHSELQTKVTQSLAVNIETCVNSLLEQNMFTKTSSNKYVITNVGLENLISYGQNVLTDLQAQLPVWFGEVDGSQTDNDGFWTVISEYYNYFFVDVPKLKKLISG